MRMSRLEFEAHQAKMSGYQAPVVETPYVLAANFVLKKNADEEKLNKTEKAWLEILRARRYPWIGIQCITLKLADDTRYTCDLWTLTAEGRLIGWETKGHRWAKNMIKLKVAARMFPFIEFILVFKFKGGWHEEPLKI